MGLIVVHPYPFKGLPGEGSVSRAYGSKIQ
jgi:hypothetical protein